MADASARKPVKIEEPAPAPAPAKPVPAPAPVEPVPAAPGTVKKPANCEAILASVAGQQCPAKGHPYKAWDMAANGDRKVFDLMACLGMEGVLRYYDWDGAESLKGKIPRPEELALIKEYGFWIALVFQHNNRPIENFASASKRARDLKEILGLVAKFKQPKGSAIYLGVDHDHWTAAELAIVRGYFQAIAPTLRAAGYRVGMYGSGANCESLAKAGLIDKAEGGLPLCWIAGASGWSGTQATLKSGRYVLHQKVDQKCLGRNLDYNRVNSKDVGQWRIP